MNYILYKTCALCHLLWKLFKIWKPFQNSLNYLKLKVAFQFHLAFLVDDGFTLNSDRALCCGEAGPRRPRKNAPECGLRQASVSVAEPCHLLRVQAGPGNGRPGGGVSVLPIPTRTSASPLPLSRDHLIPVQALLNVLWNYFQ